jgi:hypothetical protein
MDPGTLHERGRGRGVSCTENGTGAGKDCVPADSPFTMGPIALVGSRPSEEAIEQCDALLIVGSSMPYIEYYPSPGVVSTGDGSLTMRLGDFLTCVQHGLPVKIVVIKNNTLGLIKWEQMVFLGNPEYGVNMAPLDFVMFAEACGARSRARPWAGSTGRPGGTARFRWTSSARSCHCSVTSRSAAMAPSRTCTRSSA